MLYYIQKAAESFHFTAKGIFQFVAKKNLLIYVFFGKFTEKYLNHEMEVR